MLLNFTNNKFLAIVFSKFAMFNILILIKLRTSLGDCLDSTTELIAKGANLIIQPCAEITMKVILKNFTRGVAKRRNVTKIGVVDFLQLVLTR